MSLEKGQYHLPRLKLKKKKSTSTEQNIKEPWNDIKRFNICATGKPEREEQKNYLK